MAPNSVEQRFSLPVLAILKTAGWHEGRQSPELTRIDGNTPPFAAAEQVLIEFGGLDLKSTGPGVNMAKSSVQIDASLSPGLTEDLHGYVEWPGQELYPIGELDHGHANLIIDQNGSTYMLTDELTLLAPSFDKSLEVLLKGERMPPIKPGV
jgi:hypothetical protein